MKPFPVALEPGHGGPDDGACAHGLNERALVAGLAWAVAQELRKRRWEPVILPQTEGGDKVPYPVRIRAANKANAVLLALHFNAGGGRYGLVEYDAENANGDSLAQCMAARLRSLFGPLVSDVRVNGLHANDRGHVCIGGANHSAVLLEPLFLDNAAHAEWLQSHDNRAALACAIVEALEEYAAK